MGEAQDPGGEILRRLREQGARRLGERVDALVAGWRDLRPVLTDAGGASRERLHELTQSAHRLAGAGGTFGFPAVSAAAAPLERALADLAATEQPSAIQVGQAAALMEALDAAWRDAIVSESGHPVDKKEWPAGNERPVAVIAPQEAAASYAMTLASLGYAPIQSATLPLEGAPPAAVLVDDALSEALLVAQPHMARSPVLLATDDTSFPRRLAAARAGVVAILPKPLDVDELADWLDTLVGEGPDGGFSVLVIDDDALLADTYAATLRRAGFAVTAITDPAAAFEAVAATAPDLVLMDLQMPGVDGLELARVIRQTRRHLFLPIVFLSAEQDAGRQLAARRLGGDDFIAKPVDLDRLVSLVRLRAERARALRAAMERDGLTGLLNHGRFKDRLVREVERCRRGGGALSLALLDLDHFKTVNDTHGHLAGDRVLRTLARMLSHRLRQTDLVGRYGGEEFAVLLLDSAPQAAVSALQPLRERLAGVSFEAAAGSFHVTVSIGVAGWRPGLDAEGLIAAADEALYAAKHQGRDRVVVDAR